jgi:hypothetical protein
MRERKGEMDQQTLKVGGKYAIIAIAVINLLLLMCEVCSTKNRIGWLVSEPILRELSSCYLLDLIDFSISPTERIDSSCFIRTTSLNPCCCVAD